MRVPRFLMELAVAQGAASRCRSPATPWAPTRWLRVAGAGLVCLCLALLAPAATATSDTGPARSAGHGDTAQDQPSGLTLDDIERAIWLIEDIAVYFDTLAVSEGNRYAVTAWQRTSDNYRRAAARLQEWLGRGSIEVRDLPDGTAAATHDARLAVDPLLDGQWNPARVAGQRRVGGDDWPFISRLSSALFAQVGQLRRLTDWPWYREQLRRERDATRAGTASQSEDLIGFTFLKDKYLLLSMLVEAAPREALREQWAARRRSLVAEADAYLESHQRRFGRESSERLAKAWAEYSESVLTLSLNRTDILLAPDALDAYGPSAEAPPLGATALIEDPWPPPIGEHLPERRKDLTAVFARLSGGADPVAHRPPPKSAIDLADAGSAAGEDHGLPGAAPESPSELDDAAGVLDEALGAPAPATTSAAPVSARADPEAIPGSGAGAATERGAETLAAASETGAAPDAAGRPALETADSARAAQDTAPEAEPDPGPATETRPAEVRAADAPGPAGNLQTREGDELLAGGQVSNLQVTDEAETASTGTSIPEPSMAAEPTETTQAAPDHATEASPAARALGVTAPTPDDAIAKPATEPADRDAAPTREARQAGSPTAQPEAAAPTRETVQAGSPTTQPEVAASTTEITQAERPMAQPEAAAPTRETVQAGSPTAQPEVAASTTEIAQAEEPMAQPEDAVPSSETAQVEGPAARPEDTARSNPAGGGTQIEIPPEVADLEPATGRPTERVGGPVVSLPTLDLRDLFDRLAGLAGSWVNAVGQGRTPIIAGVGVTMLVLLCLTLLWRRSLARPDPAVGIVEDDRLIVIVKTNDPFEEPAPVKSLSAPVSHRGETRSTGWADAGGVDDRDQINMRTAEAQDASPHGQGDTDLMSATQPMRNRTVDAREDRIGRVDSNSGFDAARLDDAEARQHARNKVTNHATIHLRDRSSSRAEARRHLDRVAVQRDAAAKVEAFDGQAEQVAAAMPTCETDAAATAAADVATPIDARPREAEPTHRTQPAAPCALADTSVAEDGTPVPDRTVPRHRRGVRDRGQNEEPVPISRPWNARKSVLGGATSAASAGAETRALHEHTKNTAADRPLADDRDLAPAPPKPDIAAARTAARGPAARTETRNGSARPRQVEDDQPCMAPCVRPDLTAMEEMKAAGLFSDDPNEVTPQRLIEALREGKVPLFKAWFGDLTQLQRARVDRIVHDTGGEDLVLACRAVGIEKLLFASIFIAIRKQCLGEKHVPLRKLSRAMTLYDEVDPAVGQRVLARWRRDLNFPGLVEYIAQEGKGLSDYQKLAEASSEAHKPVTGAYVP